MVSGKGGDIVQSKYKDNKMKYSNDEKLLIDLQKLVSKRTDQSEIAMSLVSWFMVRKEWSVKQKDLARKLIAESNLKKKVAKKENKKVKYWLYAISDGQDVKLGFSSNINKRLKTLQTSQASELVVLWRHYTGRGRTSAMAAEKCLHRYCKAFKIRGEWFSSDCMDLVQMFKPK